jgi:hypothetical protein
VEVLKSDNTALKLQLRNLHQFHTPHSSISTEAPSCTLDHAAAKTYRDVFTSGGGHPTSTAVSSGSKRQTSILDSSVEANDNQAADGFISVLRKSKENHPSSILSGVPNLRGELGLHFFVKKTVHLFQLYQKKSEPWHFLSPDSLLMYQQLTLISL